jgi:integrase
MRVKPLRPCFVLKVPLPAVMEIMGWLDAAMARRYMHMPKEFLAAIANQVGGTSMG